MKRVFFLTVALIAISVSNLFAQKNRDLKYTNEEFFKLSDFILEGKVIGGRSYDRFGRVAYYDGIFDPEDIFTEYFFRVEYVYKTVDNLVKSGDTIVIVAERGSIGKMRGKDEKNAAIVSGSSDKRYLENNPDLKGLELVDDFMTYILFLSKTNLPINPMYKNNYLHCQFLRDREFARLFVDGTWVNDTTYEHRMSGLNDLKIKSRSEFNKYLKKFDGMRIPILDGEYIVPDEEPLTPEQQKRKDDYDKFLQEKLKGVEDNKKK